MCTESGSAPVFCVKIIRVESRVSIMKIPPVPKQSLREKKPGVKHRLTAKPSSG